MRPPPRLPRPPEPARALAFRGLADVLEPEGQELTSDGPLASARRPQVDFAFADTVFADELPADEPPPPSGPIYVRDDHGRDSLCVTPLAFPLPPASARLDAATRLRVHMAHLRHALSNARDEMRELWGATAAIVDDARADGTPALPRVVRRVGALWSCFQWSRTDLTRAAMIGLAVFITAAAVGTSTVEPGSTSARGDEVRARRTLDQHTSMARTHRAKR
jgi:hypothetical protein